MDFKGGGECDVFFVSLEFFVFLQCRFKQFVEVFAVHSLCVIQLGKVLDFSVGADYEELTSIRLFQDDVHDDGVGILADFGIENRELILRKSAVGDV